MNHGIQHGTALVHSDNDPPGIVFPGPAVKIYLLQNQPLFLPVVVLQIPADGLADIQVPHGLYGAWGVPVQVSQKGSADLLIQFFGNLLGHLSHNLPCRIQDFPLHQVLQLQNGL